MTENVSKVSRRSNIPEISILIWTPGEVAARLRISVETLVNLIRTHSYEFTELAPGGRPGDRGGHRWGLTESQLATILRGQARHIPSPVVESDMSTVRLPRATPDGRFRLKPVKARK